MRLIKDLSLKSKLLLVIMVTSSIALLLACVAFIAFDWISSEKAMVRQHQVLAKVVGENCTAALFFGDAQAAERTLRALRAEPSVVAAGVFSAEGDLFASYHRPDEVFEMPALRPDSHYFDGEYLRLFQHIHREGEKVGTVYLQSDLEELNARLQRYAGIVAFFVLGSFVVALVVAGFLQRLISQPILDLARAARQVSAQKDYSVRVEGKRRDEVGNLIEGFNEMLAQIQDRSLALRESEERFRLVVENLWEGVLLTDENDIVLYISPRLVQLTGYSAEEMMGKPAYKFLLPPDKWPILDKRNKQRIEGETERYEMELQRQDGTLLWSEIYATPYRNSSGQIIGTLGAIADISERKQAEEAKVVAERELEEQQALAMRSDRLRSLGEMAAGIAHELNQPLVGVRGLAEHILIGIERGWELPEEKLRDRAQRIVEQADRMVHIIEHVRMFAREAGKAELVPVQVNDVVHSSLEMLEAQFRSHGIEMETDLTESLPLIAANPFSLEEVLLNLLSNARDAVEEGPQEVAGRVWVRTESNVVLGEKQVQIEVGDSGGGIPKEIIDKVFDPFFTTKDPDKGTGLGLAVAKAIVEEFNGAFEIQSRVGEGTTVRLEFPVGDQVAMAQR